MPSLGENPTTFLHLISGNIHGGPGEISISKEESHSHIKSFNNFIINENKTDIKTKFSISGIVEMFNISNDTEINALKYSYKERNNFEEEMNSRASKSTFKGKLERGQYYAMYAEMRLYVFKVEDRDGRMQSQRLVVPTGTFFCEVVTKDDFRRVILDDSWGTLISRMNSPVKFYKHNELLDMIPKRSILRVDPNYIEDNIKVIDGR